MELVKSKKIEDNKELTNILYRKEMLEKTMDVTSKQLILNENLRVEIENKLKDENLSPLEKARLEVELDKQTWEVRNFATTFKSNQREYQHYIVKRIEEIGKDYLTKDDVEFIDSQKKAKELASIELYGKTTHLPDNVEFKEIIKSETIYIETLKKLLTENQKASKKAKGYELAKLQKEALDTEIHIQNLQKRLNNRITYFNEQFLPMFNEELKEAKEKIESYYNRGLEMQKSGVDPALGFLLEKYEEKKSDDESLWLFYTALRNRINSIIKELKTNHSNNKKLVHLTRPI